MFASLRQRLHLLPALQFVWQSSARWTVARAVLVVLQGTLPLALLYLVKLLIDQVALGLKTPDPQATFGPIMTLLLVFGGLSLLSTVLGVMADLVNTAQVQRITDYMQNLLLEKSIAADLEYYENADYYDTLQRAQQEAPYRPAQILNRLVQLTQNSILLMGVLGLLVSLHWGLALVVLLGSLPAFLVRLKFARVFYRWRRRRTSMERQAMYLSLMLTTDNFAKEIRLFRLGDWMRRRYRDLRQVIFKETLSIIGRRSLATLFAQSLATALSIGVFAYIAYNTLAGRLQIGDLVLFQQALQRGESALGAVLTSLSGLYEDNLFLNNLSEFLDLAPKVVDPVHPQPVPVPLQFGIEFEQVSFQYPHTERTAIAQVNLKVKAGQTIALVGENGSGKTTLIKLLCRLYDPTAGRITFDGVDLRQMATPDLRRQISVIFQDYVKYPFTARENIWIGDIQLPLDSPSIRAAATLSQADEVIRRLPQGYDTHLGKLLEQGEELSIGQWQKIALARAFVRNASVIVLDEPTAAMDPQAEAEMFEQFKALTQGQTSILISHRMSTVKMADYIYVMEQGRVVEHGTHATLMASAGTYARLFNAQAQNYRF